MISQVIEENSFEALFQFALFASAGDGIVSDKEKETLIKAISSEELLNKIAEFQGSSVNDVAKRKENIIKLAVELNSKKDLSISKAEIEDSANKITLFSLHPLAIALALRVAGSDGLPESEKNLIVSQKEEWDCDESEVSDYIEFLKSN
tara:strand:+ start:346 stop:792 length:447 start_codon:yes stop_codon:yes gene_type:complete